MELVEALGTISALLPAAAPGAKLDPARIYKDLPPLFEAYFELKLEGRLAANSSGPRNERESELLCRILDHLIKGELMAAISLAMHRLFALEEATRPDGSWSTARHIELLPPRDAGLVTNRMRHNMARDERDHQRLENASRGTGLRRREKS